jgi:alkanesulfonate monooxygenase SsuD/methylene tetrahydromethanopterin reductase-like flavin-dependent oxidoreductase (luciferase family)
LRRWRLGGARSIGWARGEFAALGVPFEHRGRLTDEALAIWKTTWVAERPAFQGRFHAFDPILFRPKPVQRPHPPLWIGGHSQAALRRVVRFGDGWHATRLAVPELARRLDELRAIAQQLGRDPAELTIALKLNLRFGRPAQAPADLAGAPAEIVERLHAYVRLGVSYVVLDVQGEGLDDVLAALRAFAATVLPELARGVAGQSA